MSAEPTEDGKKETNDRLRGVAIHSHNHEGIASIDDMSKTLLAQLEEFFVSYNKQRGKTFRITGTGGPKNAIKVLTAGIRNHKRANKK